MRFFRRDWSAGEVVMPGDEIAGNGGCCAEVGDGGERGNSKSGMGFVGE